jgi:putative flavoprotein involved in K+ transport
MRRTDALIIGGGQAGLAMSHCLTRCSIEHVVLERGRIAERWRSERWDSLRLLTPNWASRLPDWSYRGDDPDGFMSAGEFARYLGDYARASLAPVREDSAVRSLRRAPGGYRVETGRDVWHARAVVIATGHCDRPAIPGFAVRLPVVVKQITPSDYRNPAQLPAGGVLVVGASASGVQIAEELRHSGRRVTISAGRHTRVPRRYRGQDIWRWLERIGVLDETTEAVRDLQHSRREPSFQLVGSAVPKTLDLAVLNEMGVRIVGRLVHAQGTRLRLNDDLVQSIAAAQSALERLLARMDAVANEADPAREADAARAIHLDTAPVRIDLESEDIRTVIWATGYARDYSWLQIPILDAAGEIVHDGGLTRSPGLFVLGLRFMRRRKSSFIDGVGLDAQELAQAVVGYLAQHDCAVA